MHSRTVILATALKTPPTLTFVRAFVFSRFLLLLLAIAKRQLVSFNILLNSTKKHQFAPNGNDFTVTPDLRAPR